MSNALRTAAVTVIFSIISLFSTTAADKTVTDRLDQIAASIESMADDNGVAMKVTYTLTDDALLIQAVMTDEDDSIDYIAGYLDRDNALQLTAPYLAPILLVLPEIKVVSARVSDQNDQSMELSYTAEEINTAAIRH